MTERKPPGVGFETWVDKQIREATERGEFDNLPGAGEPLKNLDQPYDEVWVTRHLRKEGVSAEDLLPEPLRLRREIERLPETVRPLRTEEAVRDVVEELNKRVLAWLRFPSGPRIVVAPVKADEIVERWRADRQAAQESPRPSVPSSPHEGTPLTGRATRSTPAAGRNWWGRLRDRLRPSA